MRVFIKIYADDFKSASSTYPLLIKTAAKDLTLVQLKQLIQDQIKPSIKAKNQIISIKKAAVIVSFIINILLMKDENKHCI